MPSVFRLCRVSACAVWAVAVAAGAADPVALPGIVEPRHESRLSPFVAGTVTRLVAPEGARVHKGDVLVELDREIEELEVSRRKLAWESKAEVVAAAQRVATLSNDVAATRQLFSTTRSVSREELEKRELELKIAEAEHARLVSAEEREQIEYQMAEAQWRRRRITAPFDGVVADVYVDLGEPCEPPKPVLRLVQADQCYFTVSADAALVGGVRTGQVVRLRIGEDDARALSCTGTVDFVSPVVDPASGLKRVKVLFDNPGDRVRPGLSGHLLLEPGR